MPSPREALARSFIEAFNAGDTAALIALGTPDIEIRPLRAVLEDVVYHGPAGIEQWRSDVRESWSELTLEPGEITDVSEDRILLTGTFHARGRSTDAATQVAVTFVANFRDDLVASVRTFLDPEEAAQAASADG
jgi:ketosteroid isomerase-like protein